MFCRGSYLEFVAASIFCNYVLQRKLLGICSASIFWTPCGVGSLRDGLSRLSRLKGYKAVTFCTHVAVHSLHSCGHTIVSSCTPWPYISAMHACWRRRTSSSSQEVIKIACIVLQLLVSRRTIPQLIYGLPITIMFPTLTLRRKFSLPTLGGNICKIKSDMSAMRKIANLRVDLSPRGADGGKTAHPSTPRDSLTITSSPRPHSSSGSSVAMTNVTLPLSSRFNVGKSKDSQASGSKSAKGKRVKDKSRAEGISPAASPTQLQEVNFNG